MGQGKNGDILSTTDRFPKDRFLGFSNILELLDTLKLLLMVRSKSGEKTHLGCTDCIKPS